MQRLKKPLLMFVASLSLGCSKPTIDSKSDVFERPFATGKPHLLSMIEKCWIDVDRLWWGTALWIKERSDSDQKSTIELWSDKGSGPVMYIYLAQTSAGFSVKAVEQKHEVAQFRDFPAVIMYWAAGNSDCPDNN